MAQLYGIYMNHHNPIEDVYASFIILSNNFEEFVNRLFGKSYHVYLFDLGYDGRFKAKDNGYLWDPSIKVWNRRFLDKDEADTSVKIFKDCCNPRVNEVDNRFEFIDD